VKNWIAGVSIHLTKLSLAGYMEIKFEYSRIILNLLKKIKGWILFESTKKFRSVFPLENWRLMSFTEIHQIYQKKSRIFKKRKSQNCPSLEFFKKKKVPWKNYRKSKKFKQALKLFWKKRMLYIFTEIL